MYRHYKLNRMTSKARRLVRDLFALFVAEPECLPTEWRRRTEGAEDGRDGAGRRRLHRRDDRPLRRRRAPPPVRRPVTDLMNLYRHFQDLIAAEVAALSAAGPAARRPRCDAPHRRAAARRRPWRHRHQRRDGAGGRRRQAAARPGGAAGAAARRASTASPAAEVAGPGFINLRLHAALLARPAGRDHRRRRRLWRHRPPAPDGGSTSSTSRPIRPARCTSATAAARWSATRWRRCWRRPASRVTREYYVNDAGGQVDALARSLHVRYLIAAGALPPEAFEDKRQSGEVQYGGDYLMPAAEDLLARDGDRWVDQPESRLAAGGPRLRRRADDGADPRRPRPAGHRLRAWSPRSARWSIAAASMRRFASSRSAG